MKTKKNQINCLAIGCWLLAIGLFAGCAKVVTTKSTVVSNNTSQTTMASDEVIINNELDQFVDYGVEALSNFHASIGGTNSSGQSCVAVQQDTDHNVLAIIYNGQEPDGVKSASGYDSIHYTGHYPWINSGAKATLSFKIAGPSTNQYEIQYASILSLPSIVDTASLTFLNSVTIENMNGKLYPTAPGDTLVVKITANNIEYTFNDQAAVLQLYNINVNRIRTYTMVGSTVYATTIGDTTISGVANVGDWGYNRLGYNYYTTINTPIVQNISDLDLSYNLLSGVKDIQGIPEPIYCDYGQGGTLANGGPYGYNISWINDGVQNVTTLHYYY